MIFLKISKFFLHITVFAVILVSASTLFPFIVAKYVFFRVSVDLALLFFVLGLLTKAGQFYETRLKKVIKSPLVVAVSVFVLVFLLSGFFGYDPHFSFWSNFERGEGGFQLLHFYIFFLLLTVLFQKNKDWKKLFKFSLIAAILMITYGILAGFGVKGFIGPDFGPYQRFQGSLGNPSYVGTYLLFILFYTFYLLVTQTSKWRKLSLWALVIFFFAFFWLAGTRGAILGLGAAIFSFLFFLSFVFKKKWKFIIIGVLTFLVLSSGTLMYFKDVPALQKLPSGYIFAISLDSKTVRTRLWSWQSALQGWKERPLLGWGPENYSVVFDKYFDTRHFIPGDPTAETWYDRAHNIFFDYLTQTGLLGLLSFLSIFIVFYFEFFKKIQIHANKLMSALIFSLPIAYLVQGLVIFDILPIYLNLFLFLAFANYKFSHD